jgi:predicted phage tail protein
MQRVRLLGELGERFGAEYTYHNLRHPADAIKLLCINRPDFKNYLLKSEENGIAFKVIQAGEDMDYDELLLPFGERDLIIAPVVTGSGDSFGKILAGIGLIAISFLLPGAGLFGFASLFGATAATAGIAGTLTTIGTALSGIGASLIIGGVASMLSPQPRIPTLTADRFGSRNRTGGPTSVTRGADGVQSYAYTGAANTVGVGATVPLAYGRVLIGSHLLRSKVEVADESDPPLNSIKKPGPDTFLIGGEKLSTEFSDVSGAVVRRVYPDKTVFSSDGKISSKQNVTNTPKTLPAKTNTRSNSTTVKTVQNAKGRTLYGNPRTVNTTATAPASTPVTTTYVRQQIKTTKPAATNAAVNILASGTNSSAGSTSIQRLNALRENFNVVFNLSNGLFNYAAGAGSTFVDAFITYEINVYRSKIASENLIAIDQATIQGLLMPDRDNVTWMHKMKLPSISETVNVVVEVKIIDTDAYTTGLNGNNITLNLISIGYGLN